MFRKLFLSLAVFVTTFALCGHTAAHAQKVLLSEIAVNDRPLPGQKWRASENFGVVPPHGTTAILWEIVNGNKDTAFSVAIDVRRGPDPTILTHLVNGSVSGYPLTGAATLRDDQRGLY